MAPSPTQPDPLLHALAEFRYHLRTFLQFSEHAATEAHLHPQQHQLLLQIAGAPPDAIVSIAYAADRLGLRHHTVVELVDRSVAEDLLRRTEDPLDRRRVLLTITPRGHDILNILSAHHARELRELAPRLIRSLKRIETAQPTEKIAVHTRPSAAAPKSRPAQ